MRVVGGQVSSTLSPLFPPEPDCERARVIGDGEIHLKQVSQGTQKALGLAKRKVKDQADRQRRLDCDVRVRFWPPGLPLGGARQESRTSWVVAPGRGRITTIMCRSPEPCTNAGWRYGTRLRFDGHV